MLVEGLYARSSEAFGLAPSDHRPINLPRTLRSKLDFFSVSENEFHGDISATSVASAVVGNQSVDGMMIARREIVPIDQSDRVKLRDMVKRCLLPRS